MRYIVTVKLAGSGPLRYVQNAHQLTEFREYAKPYSKRAALRTRNSWTQSAGPGATVTVAPEKSEAGS